MTRYNSFNQIHKGLRALLYDTALQVQIADMSSATDGEQIISKIEEVLYLFESHAHGEDHFFNEPLEEVDSRVSKMFIKEHEEDHRLAEVLVSVINDWKYAKTDKDRCLYGRNLFYAFNEFIAFNLYHMNKEEIELNAVLWNHYSDSQIKATEQQLVQQIPADKMARYAKWMIRGINDAELTHWFREVKALAPAPVFEMLNGIAQQELDSKRFHLLQRSLEVSIAA
ncbi:MAG: hypothetical protein R2820_05625 [Cyclobacteriaceae bacterium]|nr:hypothetical protein [Cyclobacteriaceae bacterium]